MDEEENSEQPKVDSREAERLAERAEKIKPQHRVNVQTPADIVDILENIHKQKDAELRRVIVQRVHIPASKLERPIEFWKNIYISTKKEGRFLNGIEAYELGDPKITPDPNKGPYIAMCNLMALEAIRMMGDDWPTIEDAKYLALGTDREVEIASFWHDVFAPTGFQSEWAWKAAMAVMAGEPFSTKELLVNYQDQLP